MKTEIELPDNSLNILNEICTREKISCSEAVARALENYAGKSRLREQATLAFGLWKLRQVDALEYEDTIRKEWER